MHHTLLDPPTDLTANIPLHAGMSGVLSFETKQFHFIYKTTNVITGEYYIGLHSTNDLHDAYLGSGIRLLHSIKKHGRDNFIRVILEHCSSRQTLSIAEEKLVTEDLLNDPKCLNLAIGGSASSVTKSVRHKMSMSRKGRTPENFQKFRESGTDAIRGKKHTEETRAKMRTAKSKRTVQQVEEFRQRMKIAMREAWRRKKAVDVHASA